MRPKINPGDEVITDLDTDISQIQPGDDVTFIHDNGNGSESYYTHEVQSVYDNPLTGERELTTKGVNNDRRDRNRVTSEDYIGKVESTNAPIIAGGDVP